METINEAVSPEIQQPCPEESAPTIEERLNALSRQILEQMEQSAQAERERRNALDQREEALKRQEMAALTRTALEKRGLPSAFSECMAFRDEAAMESAVALLEECFRTQVQRAVEERLLDGPPVTASLRSLKDLSDAEYYAAVCGRE